MNDEVFKLLVIGLAQFLYNDGAYPYPDLLRYSLNSICLQARHDFPHTLSGLGSYLGQPVNQGLGVEPTGFDPDAPLLYDGALSEEASEFLFDLLEETQLTLPTTLAQAKPALDNHKVRVLLDELWAIYQQGNISQREQAQQEYIRVRDFLDTTAWATVDDIHELVFGMRYITPEQVNDMYQDPGTGPYWNCINCGPLTLRNEVLRGIKPSLCDSHQVDAPNVEQIPSRPGLRVLKRGVHMRTHIPGLAEMQIQNQLEAIRDRFPEQLTPLVLWPGIDRYDIQLRFRDKEVWAIDIKDYKDPYQLGKHLTHIYEEGELQYDLALYVVPNRRFQKRIDYLETAMREAAYRANNHVLVSDEDLVQRVTAKVKQLKKGR